MMGQLNLPNRITLARLALAILFFILVAHYSQRAPRVWMLDAAVAVFIVAAVTDILDGYIARSRGLVTPLGRVLDPFVDKVLVCGAFILYAGHGFVDESGGNVTGVSAWMVVVIVGRELLVTGLRGFSESVGKSFAATLHGKLKMWVQSITAPAILIIIGLQLRGHMQDVGETLKTLFVWITVIVTALSSIQYIMRARPMLEAGAPK
jgi:CDP-diacylglycerol--glycerol-3-phosphate 3-phosphatidyltransferase